MPSGVTPTFSWEHLPTTQGTRTNSGQSTIVNWINSPNFPNKTIKVTMTFPNGLTFTDTRAINVKHIGGISSVQIAQANPSVIVNNGTTSVPCGPQSLNLTVSPPVVDPSSPITYEFTYPSGWSGPATSNSNAITVSTNSGGGGTMVVRAFRTDNPSLKVSLTFTITRPVVSALTISHVSGPNGGISNPLCNTEISNYVGNAQNASAYFWAGSGITFTSGTNSANTSFRANQGLSTLTLSASNLCGTVTQNRSIYWGVPTLTPLVNGAPSQSTNIITLNPAFLTSGALTGTSWSWQLACNGGCGPSTILPNGSNCYASAMPFINVRHTASNRCGTSNPYFFYVYNTAFGGGGFRVASQNPSQDEVDIEILEFDIIKDYIDEIYIASERNGKIQKFGKGQIKKNLKFSIRNLPNDTYFVSMVIMGHPITEQIIKM